VEARDYSMRVNVLQQIKTSGIVPGSGFDYAQTLIKQNKHTNGVPVTVLQLFTAKIPPPPPNCQIHIRNYVLMLYLYVNKYIDYFQRKIQLSRFSAYLDGLPSQLIQISVSLLY
jgi:hypothetical protein